MRVVATAGHVDHGKSSLVLALTGTDPDRFAEEKARGLTIDLGFAFTTLPSGAELGFVDVPGHVRFLKNMLAGVGAVDVALLVVAATEGWMPQTEEHQHILELLGIGHGVVAVTKADLVDAERVATVLADVERRLAPTALADAPIVVCDARSGRGLTDLALALDAVLAATPAPSDAGRPRLWIDRVFSARGAGTVVTGTLVGGTVARDDELEAMPLRRRVRVRGLESAHQRVDVASPGSRVACNLVGVDHHELHRGDALVRAGQWTITAAVDVALTTFADVELPARGRGQAYVGSGEHECRWRVFGDGRYARVIFAVPLALAPGDRLVLRDPGREEIVAGATVLDAEAIGSVDAAARHLALDAPERFVHARGWLARGDLARVAGLPDAVAAASTERAAADGGVVAIGDWLVDPVAAANARDTVRTAVDEYHRAHPTGPGLELAMLGARLGLDDARARAVAASTPGIAVEHGRARDLTHTGSAAADPASSALLAALDTAPFTPPAPADRALARALVREGLLVDVNGIVFSATALERARGTVAAALARQGEVTVGDVRELLTSTRKYVVPLLEWFDARGVTRRRGDVRIAGPRVHAPLWDAPLGDQL